MKMNEILTLETEAGFKVLFQNAAIGILVINSQGHIELANPFIGELFDYAQAEIINQSVEILIPEAFRYKHVQHREEYMKNPKARPMGYGLNLFALKKDGTEFPVEISLSHCEINHEELVIVFITDITEIIHYHEDVCSLTKVNFWDKNKLDTFFSSLQS